MKRKGTADAGTKKRDNFLHQSLFMPKGLPDGAELAYFVKGQKFIQKLIEGYKQGSTCCNGRQKTTVSSCPYIYIASPELAYIARI
ncbi:hypothetical protein J1N35_040279 [Gossypium stocksii]|uniref:Uncharacterized protein n=1 Tax=Gossypium stocksii TaxID=47602 RepID=A0A9D3UDI5_9ROSI|nr:hypothetical protein J1N35_040279 [Gossypium stocksii]